MPQLKPTRGICINRSHPLSRGLVGLWLFNEGSGGRAFDLSGDGNIGIFGTTTAAPYWTSGKFGQGLGFAGTLDYINCGAFRYLETFTLEAWIKAETNVTIYRTIIDKSSGTTNRNFWLSLEQTTGVLGLRFSVAGASRTFIANTAINDNVWHHVAAVYDKSYVKLYVDGILDITPGTQTGAPGNPVANCYIGYQVTNNTRVFFGIIDVVRIFNRALSASEIAQLYREPFCMFEEAMRPKLISGQIVNLAGSSAALSYSGATAKAMRKVGGNVAGTSDVTALLNLIRSLLNIERNWLREALFNGMTANAYKLGTTLSLGWFWVRVAGCSVLYRGSDMDEIDFVNILAVAEQDACEISPPSYISHNSGSTYFYVVRRFNNCGYQECTLAASVKVSIESNGDLSEPQPNKVFDSGAELLDGNKIQLVWYYCPLEQKSQPMCFNVYYDGRTGQIDHENPLATIEYQGRKFYGYQSSALEAGKYLFAIRAEDAGGIENSSLAQLSIQFDTTNPNAIDILSAEAV